MPSELLLTAPRTIQVAPYEEQSLGPQDIRARAICSGVSHGTELALYRGISPFGSKRFDLDLRLFVEDAEREAYPVRLGYEWVGTVTEVGSEVQSPSVGDRVHLAKPHRQTQALTMTGEAAALWTALPEGLEPARATFLRTASIALQAVHDARLELGSRIAVFGLGTFGLLSVQLARVSGAEWAVAVDPIARRRELAAGMGADLVLDPNACDVGREIKLAKGGTGVDVAIEFSGSYTALQDAMRSARLAGTVVAAGFYMGSAGAELRLGEEWHHNRLTLVSSMSGWGAPARQAGWDRRRLSRAARELLSSGQLVVEPLVTHRIPFERAAEAYELIDRGSEDVLRVILTYD